MVIYVLLKGYREVSEEMNVLIQRVYLQSKNMRFLFFIPLIGYYVVIPILFHIMQINPAL